EGMALWLVDNRAPSGDRALTGDPAAARGAGFVVARSLQVPGIAWTVYAARDRQYLVAHGSLSAWIVLIGGLVLDSLLGTFLLILTGRTARIESIVSERTHQLSQTTDALEQEFHDREVAEHALRSSENQLRSVTDELQRAKEAAEAGNRAKSD